MADDIDLANNLMDAQISRALNRIREESAKAATGSDICEECGDTMPAPRVKMGFSVCVSCAEEGERRQHLYTG